MPTQFSNKSKVKLKNNTFLTLPKGKTDKINRLSHSAGMKMTSSAYSNLKSKGTCSKVG